MDALNHNRLLETVNLYLLEAELLGRDALGVTERRDEHDKLVTRMFESLSEQFGGTHA